MSPQEWWEYFTQKGQPLISIPLRPDVYLDFSRTNNSFDLQGNNKNRYYGEIGRASCRERV